MIVVVGMLLYMVDACCCCFFFFKQKTAYEMRISDWSSDVCSSDLRGASPQGENRGDGGDRARAGRAARPDARGASEPARAGRARRTGRKRECRTPPGRRDACLRSDERRGGKKCDSMGRSRWWPDNYKTNTHANHSVTYTSVYSHMT